MATRCTDQLLAAMLGTLLPGGDDWPSALGTHVVTFVTQHASEVPELAQALDAVCGALARDFASQDLDARAAMLRDAETRLPDAFTQIVTAAYRGYYTDPRVLAVIEHKTRYPARPPQPLGRTVRAADWSVLAGRAIATAPLPALLDSLGEPHDS